MGLYVFLWVYFLNWICFSKILGLLHFQWAVLFPGFLLSTFSISLPLHLLSPCLSTFSASLSLHFFGLTPSPLFLSPCLSTFTVCLSTFSVCLPLYLFCLPPSLHFFCLPPSLHLLLWRFTDVSLFSAVLLEQRKRMIVVQCAEFCMPNWLSNRINNHCTVTWLIRNDSL